jgi:hypothetical protein
LKPPGRCQGKVGPAVLKHDFKIGHGEKRAGVDDHGGEGEATTPTEQRSQELCADDTVSNYSLFVFEHDNL